MSDHELLVNDENEFDEISECQDEITNNFTIIPNALIRDQSISPECRWLIIYFLSNKKGWTIKRSQLVHHVKGYIGRDKILKVFDEGIKGGYIKRDVIKKKTNKGFLKGFKYTVASTPKFKKCLPYPDYQGPVLQEPDLQEPDSQGAKEYYPKEQHTLTTNTSLKVPENEAASERLAGANVANATGEVLENPQKSKREKKPPIFSASTKEVADKMLAILVQCNPVYRPPENLDKFLAQVETMLETDKQDPEIILKTFEWACADSEQRDSFKGWQSVVCTNKRRGKASNPAEIFRGHFSTIYAQMMSQPKRKFAPSSDDARSLKKWDEAMKGAI